MDEKDIENIENLELAKEELNKILVYRENLFNYYKMFKNSLESLQALKNNKELFLPLGSDIFVFSEVKDLNSILVNVGSNIFLEMSLEEAEEFLNRRISEIEEEINNVTLYAQSIQNYISELLKTIKK